MRLPSIAAIAAVLAAFTFAAHADTISTFSLTNYTFQSGATATGTIVIDTTNGIVASANITYVGGTTVLFNMFPGQGTGVPDLLYRLDC